MENVRKLIRQILTAMILMSLTFPTVAQTDTLQNNPNLLLPQFTKSVVKLKSGETYTEILNYDFVEQIMVSLQNKLIYVLDKQQLIDTIFMDNRIFVPFGKSFYELMVKGPVSLFIQHNSRRESIGTPIGYGETSQYSPPPSNIRQTNNAYDPIVYEINPRYKVTGITQYWLSKGSTMYKFNTKSQFIKIFPDKENELNQFIKENRINLKNVDKLITLVNFCNEFYK